MNNRFKLLWLPLLVLVIVLQAPELKQALAINHVAVNALSASDSLGLPLVVERPTPASSVSAQRLVLLGLAAREQGHLGVAIYYLEQAVQLPQARAIWWFQLADLCFQTGDLERSLATLSQIENVERLVLTYCKSAIHNVKLERAARWCLIIPHLGQTSTEGSCLLIRYYVLSDQPDKAEFAFEQATAQPDVSAECLYQYGLYLHNRREYEKALWLHTRAFEKDRLPRYMCAIARAYSGLGRLDEAIAACQQAYALSLNRLDRAESLTCMGGIYFYRYRDYEQASHFLQAAIDQGARVDTSVYWLLAQSERQLGHPDEAIRAYQVVDDRKRGGMHLLSWRHEYAAYLVELGMEAEARQVYLGILQDAPDDPIAKGFLGQE